MSEEVYVVFTVTSGYNVHDELARSASVRCLNSVRF